MFKYRCRECKEKRPYQETVRPWGICLECYHKAKVAQKENHTRLVDGILAPTVDVLLIDYIVPLADSSRMIDADEADRMLATNVKEEPLQWQPLEPSQQTLEFMAHQEEVMRQICSVFAITPQELGVPTLNAGNTFFCMTSHGPVPFAPDRVVDSTLEEQEA